MEYLKHSRRDFIKSMGCLSIGFSFFGTACMGENPVSSQSLTGDLPGSLSSYPKINAWLEILADGRVRILTGKMELGQGIRTAILQVAAEELNMDLDLVEINLAETGYTPDEGYTAGSRSIESSAMAVRYAAASAREKLLEMAAKRLDLKTTSLTLKDGVISGEGKEINLYDLLDGKQIDEEVTMPSQLKGKSERKIVGQPIKRRDIADMVIGNHTYVQDLRFPDMVHARVIRPKSYNSKLQSFEESALDKNKGLLKVVNVGSFLGVIAEEEYQAVQLREKIKKIAQWSDGKPLPHDTPLKEHIKSLQIDANVDEEKGDWKSGIDSAETKFNSTYFKPYIMHAANGPSCAVALFKEGKLDVWTHSQGVYPLRRSMAAMLDIPEENIHIKGVPGSGCYGHNGADDVAAEAALFAVNYPGKHVRLQWMRDDEHGWEPYGTAMMMELQAGLNQNGEIQGWKYDLWSDGHSTRPGGSPDSLLPARYLDKGFGVPGTGFRGGAVRNAPPYYNIETLQVQSHIFEGPLRKSALRGLGAYANIFAIESFMDELANKAGIDPIKFRLNHLSDPRAIECIERIKENTKGISQQENEGLGYAFSRYKNSASYCAVAALVEVNRENGHVQVKKMWAVIDSGETINPDGLKNQTEGGMIQSASWALKEDVKFDETHITSLDWVSYPIFRFRDAPETEVEVIDRVNEPPLGAGEAAQGPATAAITNAIFEATGVRIYELPVKSELLVQK